MEGVEEVRGISDDERVKKIKNLIDRYNKHILMSICTVHTLLMRFLTSELKDHIGDLGISAMAIRHTHEHLGFAFCLSHGYVGFVKNCTCLILSVCLLTWILHGYMTLIM